MSQILRLRDNDQAQALSGKRDEYLRLLEEAFDVKIVARGLDLIINGSDEAVAKVKVALESMAELGSSLTNHDVYYAIKMSNNGGSAPQDLNSGLVVVTHRGHRIRPKTAGQKRYIAAMASHDIVFSIGPAGTGKTYLAMAHAVACLKRKEVERLILTRPAVEAGEHLGFLPGDLQDKVDPYLRPLYDALFDILGHDTYSKYREKGIIEIAPLAYMRGRTLDDSFIILDEAQNCTPEQMKMFLTRLGFGSKAVITGDITQVDLPKDKTSGLIEVQRILRGVEGIAFCSLGEADVVRHPLVQRIIKAYEAHDEGAGKLQS
ncbi:MAG TPA: PhoH family protein [Firmicutes bacterium]|nr:PhoH family protein [Bacillota bacterium]